jgi:nicotinamidase-related amidase
VSDWTLVGKTALVVVHMQNAICKSPSPLDFMGHQRATAEDEVIPHIAGLLAAFRS